MKNIFKLIICILICYAAGGIGAIFTTPAIPVWYSQLIKPPLIPPNWVFGPVWSTLYTFMGIALFFIIQKGFFEEGVLSAVILFDFQLMLNILWSIVFFGFKDLFLPIFIIVGLWGMLIACIVSFWKISRVAAILLIPYFLWVSFAIYLNIWVYVLNE